MLEEEEDVVLGLVRDEPFEVGLELGDVVGEEEPGIGEEVLIAGVLERLGIAPVEVEEVGGRVEADGWRRTSCLGMSSLKRRIMPLYWRAWRLGCCLVLPPAMGEKTMPSMSLTEAVSQALSSMMRALSCSPSLPARRTSMRERPTGEQWYSMATVMSPETAAWLRTFEKRV